jgi:hypothetical protein
MKIITVIIMATFLTIPCIPTFLPVFPLASPQIAGSPENGTIISLLIPWNRGEASL